MNKPGNFVLILLLGALATISPFSIDMYLPGFPGIAKALDTSIDKVQLSLTSYFIGVAVGQLLYGPLLDRFGRRSPLYIGLFIYVCSSVLCAFAGSVESLIAFRLLQALGGCVGMVASQALVRDVFPANKTAQVFSLITLVIAVSPMIAPTIGGYVTAHAGWQWVFIILGSITALIGLASYYYLPPGKGPNPAISLLPHAVVRNFFLVGSHPQFLVYSLAGGLAMAAPFAYIAGSPDVFMNIYGLTEQQYGWVFALLAAGLIGSSQFTHILLRYWKSEQIIRYALLSQGVIGILLVAGTLYGGWGLYGLIVLLFLFLCGHGLIGPNATSLTLAPFEHHAGSAAALLGAWRMGAGAIMSAMVSFLHDDTAMPMVGVMAGCAWISLLILLLGRALTARYIT
ncbi:MAG TPA: multidrug effflux MFS transporter [Chryseolinea sp.]|nr:multidrug effflux MFS transporter [Chryseolinea sp.]